MKKYLLIGLSIFALANLSDAEELANLRTITVTGNAEIRVMPDQATISMSINTRAKDLISAKKKNNAVLEKTISYFIDELKLDKKFIQTDYVTITPQHYSCRYDEKKCNALDVEYYRVNNGIKIRLNDLTKYEDLISKSLEFGVTNINNVEFSTTELRKHKDKARELAAKAAREKAKAIANTLDMEVLKPTYINLNSSGWGYRGYNASMNNVQNVADGSSDFDSELDGTSFSLGQISITAQANVTFEIE